MIVHFYISLDFSEKVYCEVLQVYLCKSTITNIFMVLLYFLDYCIL